LVAANEALANKYAEEKALIDQKRRDKEEAHLYMDISVASNNNFQHHQGIDIVPNVKTDLVDPAAMPRLYREKKKLPFAGLVRRIASDLGVDADMLRVWSMVGRQNSTVRPDHPITPTNLTVEEAFAKYGNKQAFRLWVEVADEKTGDGKVVFANERIKVTRPGDKAILLFLKHFDVDKQTLYGVGQFYCAWYDKVSEIGPDILKLMNWPTGTNFRIYEVRKPPNPSAAAHILQEIKQSMIEPLKAKSSLQQAELQDGDIITVMRAIPDAE
jgi:ubiquitin carboxyl-terminal hydrolase 7